MYNSTNNTDIMKPIEQLKAIIDNANGWLEVGELTIDNGDQEAEILLVEHATDGNYYATMNDVEEEDDKVDLETLSDTTIQSIIDYLSE